VHFRLQCVQNGVRLKDALSFGRKVPEILTIWDSYIPRAKSNPLRTLKQIKSVQDLHSLLCAYDGRDVFEPEGSEESCLDNHPSSRLPVVWQKRGQVLVRLIMLDK